MKIKNIKRYHYEGLVHNFHCLPNENYFSEGILVHNCYKSNNPVGVNMSFETFKEIFHKLPRPLTQVAFGADSSATANKDLFRMMEYCLNNDYQTVIPNITVAQISDSTADKLAQYCGAVAISRYDPDVCYNMVKKLTDRGMTQINIHQLLSEETYEDCLQVLSDACTDPRLEKLNAIVFLALKPKGRGTTMTPMRSVEKYKQLVDQAFAQGVGIGFDSCSAPMFLSSVKDRPNYEQLEQLADPCESTLFSLYIDSSANVWPCSFLENEQYEPINMLEIDDFIEEVWQSESLGKFRQDLTATAHCEKALVNGCRECPKYNIYREE